MTRLPLVALFLPALASAQALGGPYYESPIGRVRASSGMIGAFGPGAITTYGLGGMFEPRAAVTDQLAVGFRVDAAALLGVESAPLGVTVDWRLVGAVMLKGELALIPGDARPFIGAGLGWYAVVITAGSPSGASTFTGSGPGVMPQLGFDLGWFRCAGQYHLLFGDLGRASYFAVELSWRVY